MVEVEDRGELKGWERWERVYRAVDMDTHERWYFTSDAILCDHCVSAGQDELEAELATIDAYWIDADGQTGGGVAHVCKECFEAGHPSGPGYVLTTTPLVTDDEGRTRAAETN